MALAAAAISRCGIRIVAIERPADRSFSVDTQKPRRRTGAQAGMASTIDTGVTVSTTRVSRNPARRNKFAYSARVRSPPPAG
jgi:hypothetical protein